MRKTPLKNKTIPAKKPRPHKKVLKKEISAKPEKEFGLGLWNLAVPFGAHKDKRILGRGSSSGHGKTSTRGSKGQTSRAGRHFYPGFEGGQSPLIRRIPKRGFTSRDKTTYQIVNLQALNKLNQASVNPQVLAEKGLIKDKLKPVKILGSGELKNSLTIQAQAFSKSAQEKIEKAGGKAEIIHASSS